MFVNQSPKACERPQRRPKRRSYHVKPPSSYIAMISSAILSSPEKKMTLADINDHLMSNYECFRGEYQGWKNSVRHNLSFNKCFVKINRNPLRPWAKDNYWKLDLDLLEEYLMENGEFRRRRKRRRNVGKSYLALNSFKHTNTSRIMGGTKLKNFRPLISSFVSQDKSAHLESSCISNAQQTQLSLSKGNPYKYCTTCSIPASSNESSLFRCSDVTALGFDTPLHDRSNLLWCSNSNNLQKAKTVPLCQHQNLSSGPLANNFSNCSTFKFNTGLTTVPQTALGFVTSFLGRSNLLWCNNSDNLQKAKTVPRCHQDLSSRPFANNFANCNTFKFGSGLSTVQQDCDILGPDVLGKCKTINTNQSYTALRDSSTVLYEHNSPDTMPLPVQFQDTSPRKWTVFTIENILRYNP